MKNSINGISVVEMEADDVKPIHDLDLDDIRIQRLACTGKRENCSVHNINENDQRYYYYVENQGIQKVF